MEISGSNSLKATILFPTFSSNTTQPTQIDQLLAKHPTKLEQGILKNILNILAISDGAPKTSRDQEPWTIHSLQGKNKTRTLG